MLDRKCDPDVAGRDFYAVDMSRQRRVAFFAVLVSGEATSVNRLPTVTILVA
jgi:hypothetical protein